MQTIIKINKQDSSKKQLETAINLFFNYGDEISIHTLVSAAYNVLCSLAKKKNIKIIVKSEDVLRNFPIDKKSYFKKINEAENFFKHADTDFNKILEFEPLYSYYFLFDSIRIYYLLTGEETNLMSKFNVWFYIKYPNLAPVDIKDIVNDIIKNGINPDDRNFFMHKK